MAEGSFTRQGAIVFLYIFGIAMVFGLILGVVQLTSPDTIPVGVNETRQTGWSAFWFSLLICGIPGLIAGTVVGRLVTAFTRPPPKPAAKPPA